MFYNVRPIQKIKGRIKKVSKSYESFFGSPTSIGSELLVRFLHFDISFPKRCSLSYALTNIDIVLFVFTRFLIVPPQEKTAESLVLYLRAFLFSTQGLFVAIFYCFLNDEVKDSIKNYLERRRSLRSLYSQKYSRPAGSKAVHIRAPQLETTL